jgi:DNA-binding Lrp family transcriptional regulator
MSPHDPPIDIEVYVHTAGTSVWAEQAQHVRRVEELTDRGVVRRASVDVWPRRVCVNGTLEETAFHTEALTTIEQLSAWGEREGVALPFERRHVVSELARTDHEVVDTPAVCVAARVDGTLTVVAPHRHPSRCCSVEDLLDRVARSGAAGLTCQGEVRPELANPSVTTTESG